MQEVIFWGIWAVLGLIMLLYYLRRKRSGQGVVCWHCWWCITAAVWLAFHLC